MHIKIRLIYKQTDMHDLIKKNKSNKIKEHISKLDDNSYAKNKTQGNTILRSYLLTQ